MAKKKVEKKKTAKSKKLNEGKAPGDQLDLIDTVPENLKPIVAAVEVYKKFQAARLGNLKQELIHKKKVLDLVKAAGIAHDEEGLIKMSYGDKTIIIEPRDDLIKIIKKSQPKEKIKE